MPQNEEILQQIPNKESTCPLTNEACTSECAWYLSKKGKCAIWVLANSKK